MVKPNTGANTCENITIYILLRYYPSFVHSHPQVNLCTWIFFIVPDKKLRKIPVYKLGVINFQFYNIAIPYFVSFYH